MDWIPKRYVDPLSRQRWWRQLYHYLFQVPKYYIDTAFFCPEHERGQVPIVGRTLITKWGNELLIVSSTIGLVEQKKGDGEEMDDFLSPLLRRVCLLAWTNYTTNSTFLPVLQLTRWIQKLMLSSIHHNLMPLNHSPLPFVFCSLSSHDAIFSFFSSPPSYPPWLQVESPLSWLSLSVRPLTPSPNSLHLLQLHQQQNQPFYIKSASPVSN